MALGIMATNAEVKNALKKIDVIPSLIDKLSIEDVVVHEFATLCLALLSVDYVCKVKIFESNGLPPLIQLLTSPDPDVKKNSLEIIFNTAQDYQSRQAVHESGGISLILNLVMSDFPVIQHLALKTLHILTTDKENCITFREAQGFEKLMDILNNAEFIDLHVDTLRVVANCLSDSETSQMIHESGGLARLMEFVLITEVPDIRNNAVTCLAKAALNPDNRKHLHQHNVEKVLVDLLAPEGEDVCVKTATCKAVHAMSFHESSRDTLGELGVIPEIVQCLRSKNLNLKEAATEALLGLTFDNHFNSLKVFKAGGQKILVQHLKVVCPKLLSNSAATLTNMAEMEVIRSGILSQGAVTALVEHLTLTDAHILVSILQCLTMLVGDAEARAELHAAKGLQPLVDLLCYYDKEVLHHACLVINVCATDEPSAIEMHRLGALEKLQAINQSQNRKSCYSNLAMITLVNANMSIKYSLTGHLSATDIITDGFYDVGKAHADERILTLEELARQPVNQHKPIIVINTSTGETKDNDRPAEDKSWQMMNDTPLQNLVKEAKEYFLSLSDERGQYAALARLVSDAMGGAVKRDNLHGFLWVLHLCELKMELKSNVVPIGFIKRGIYCHRALLFKCLADCIGLSCTLVRGEYSRAWNEVLLLNPSSDESFAMPSRYIVDLMHDPGSLLPVDATAATQYQII
ncbi:armadillo repeat-containing protein 3 isoform X2 [Nelusetta ayraudi]